MTRYLTIYYCKEKGGTSGMIFQGVEVNPSKMSKGRGCTKSASITRFGEDEAFCVADTWCRERAQEAGIEYRYRSKEELLNAYQKKKSARKEHKKPDYLMSNPLTDIFGHLGKFRATVRQTYKQKGFQFVKDIADEIMNTLEEASAKERAEAARVQSANQAIAVALFEVERKNGISMMDQCPNDAVRQLYVQRRNQQLELKKRELNIYDLDGEIWKDDGRGDMPASFKRWLREDESREIAQLAVN